MADSTDLSDLTVLQPGLPADDVDRRIGLAYVMAGIKHRVVAFYLADADARGLHQLYGFSACAQYAAVRFGMSRREARDLLTVGKALRDLPQIDRAFAAGHLSWTKVRELIKVATAEHESKWVERAKALSTDELTLEVRLARPGDPPRRWDDRKGLPEIRLTLEAQLPAEVHAKWECVRRRVQDDTPHAVKTWEVLDAAFDALLAQLDDMDAGKETSSRSAPRYCVVVRQGTEADAPVAVETDDGPVALDAATAAACCCAADRIDPENPDGRADRRIPDRLRRKVLARDGHRCRSCKCRLRLELHHVIEWSAGGPTDEGNLLTLCRKCHALVHAGMLAFKADGAGGWRLIDSEGHDLGGCHDRLREIAMEIDTEHLRLRIAEPVAPTTAAIHQGTPYHPAPRRRHDSHRPTRFDQLVGQNDIVADLAQAVRLARANDEPLGHTLLMGGPGLGKTSIAGVVAAELGAPMTSVCGPHVKETAEVVGLLRSLRERDILFIDGIHALPGPSAEALYEAMDDFKLSVLPGQRGEGGTACQLAPFTLVGATTEPGRLPGPLLSRFENRHWIGHYETRDLAMIIERAADRAKMAIEPEASSRMAAGARGMPREALRLLRRASRQARAVGSSTIDDGVVRDILESLGLDERGLDALDRAYLEALSGHGPVGLGRLASILGVDPRVLERDHEPHLFRLGLATTTPHGRVLRAAS